VVLIAPDSFKGTHPSTGVAAAIARGLAGEADLCPLADGGEGTLDVVLGALDGVSTGVVVQDPLGRPVAARLGWIADRATAIANRTTAIVESATASGLGLVDASERDAEAASTFGTGELIAAAVAGGARRVVVAAGGSATTDGGAGAIEAIERHGGLRGAKLLVACDVRTPFERAPALFARQKGADGAGVERLSARMERLARDLPRDPRGVPLTGAAGGLSGGLWARYRAELVPGADWVLDATGFDERLGRSEAVVTGEGRLDRQTFEGKLAGAVAARAARAGKPVHAVVGATALDDTAVAELGLASVRVAGDERAIEAAGSELRTRFRGGDASVAPEAPAPAALTAGSPATLGAASDARRGVG
jgi:glycerate kinase